MKFRIGHGIDIHAFEAGDHIMLGGVKVPHTHGITAHSDGDVVLHAITDALLGALCMGDIGQWFPDTDPDLHNIESKDLILPIIMSMRSNGYDLNNLDVTVIAQTPKLRPHSDDIRQSIAKIFSCDVNKINIKATTAEKLGAFGRSEGICAHAVISLIGQTTEDEFLSELIEDSQTIDVSEFDVSGLKEAEEIDLSQEVDLSDFDFGDLDPDSV